MVWITRRRLSLSLLDDGDARTDYCRETAVLCGTMVEETDSKKEGKKNGDRVVSCGHSQLEDGNDDDEVKRIYIYM